MAALLAAGLAGTAPAGAGPLLFDDEFNGSSLDLHRWYRCYPYEDESYGCTNGPPYDLEWYWKHSVSVAGGQLRLTARRQQVHGYHYTSGLIVTGGSPHRPPAFSFLYGYAEMRAKFPPGAGMWPAFWLLPANGQWPPEIDAMEWQGGTPTIDYATIHWGKQVNGRHPSDGTAYQTGVDLSAGFHTYGVDWQADAVTWYFDGRVIKKFTNRAAIPHQPMYLLVDLAVGGWISFPTARTRFPATMAVDYVRVWRRKPPAP